MSEVYLALLQGGLGGFQKLIAVKLLRRDLAEDESFRRMFLDEARLTAQLNHPNVVQTNDVGEDRGRYYIAMEYLEGQTFERARRARNAGKLFPVNLQLAMLADVLAGLHYAHELVDYDGSPLAIVHRDVTPSNVFITYDGQVKLVDFGIAKVLDSLNHTQVGVMKGKVRYMAPEQIAGGSVDRRADVFSAGVMLWEILSGGAIWHGKTEPEILRRVVTGELPPLLREAPPALQRICTRAMAHRAEDRYPTAEALRVDLEGYLAQHITPTRERGIGAAISELFRDERAQIRHVIEDQLRGSRPGAGVLPELRGAAVAQTGATPVPFALEPIATRSGVQVAPSAQRVVELAPPGGAPRKRRSILLAAGAGLAVAALVVVLVAARRDVAEASRGPQPAAAVAGTAAAEPPRAQPHPAAAPVAVRGVTDDSITVGMSAAFSGPSRELGNRMKLGLDTAFAAINEAGGVSGRKLKLFALDDGYDAKRALSNAQQLLDERGVFALIGNVGTPTIKEALPYVLGMKAVLFGAFTGTGLLRRDPPDRYVFNYRASYEDETAKMVSYLVDVKKVPDRGIVVFAQSDSYGDAGFDGATKMLRKKGRSDEVLRVGYERNTLAVDDAVTKVLDYHNATVRVGTVDRPRHPVKAIIMVGTYKACARFIQKIRDRKLDALVLNVSFVGSNALADELKEFGPGYGNGVIVTQVVPHFDSGATGIIHYREALQKYHPDQAPDFVSLEGYIVGRLFAEGLRGAGRDLDTEKLVDALERVHDYDPGTGGTLTFSMSQHQASNKVWATMLDEHGVFRSIDLE
jgi:ABC-type branched-subunit amino acid transport system substrate-binding protein/tRNA A-37 threonylcarbamoyl transferase component Bud32